MKKCITAMITLFGMISVFGDFTDDFNRTDTSFSSDGSVIGASWVGSRMDGLWRIQNNQLEADTDTANTALYYTGEEMSCGGGTSFVVRVEVTPLVSNAWAGIVFHYQNNEQFYWLRIKSGTTTALMDIYDNGTATRLKNITSTETFLPNTAYTLTVRAVCPYNFVYEIKESATDEVLASGWVEDPADTYAGGYAGILQGTTASGRHVFDDFELDQTVGPYVYIDAELDPADAEIWGFFPKENPPDYWPGEFIDNGQLLRVYEHEHWHVRPWVSTSSVVNASNSSAGCIGFHAVAAPDNYNIRDRHELCVSQNLDVDALTLNQRRYLAFDFYIDPISETPQNWVAICQAWQVCTATPPPFSIHVRSDAYNSEYPDADHVILDFEMRDDSMIEGDATNVWSVTVEKGTWHNLILQLQPSPLNDGETGQMAIYYDNEPGEAPDYVWANDWGYSTNTVNIFGDTFDVRVGVYRRKQMRAFSWFVDNIRFGPTKESVEW